VLRSIVGVGDLLRAAERVHGAIAEFGAREVDVVIGRPDAELAHVIARDAGARRRAQLVQGVVGCRLITMLLYVGMLLSGSVLPIGARTFDSG